MRRSALAAAAAVALILVAAAPADAFRQAGPRWPGKTFVVGSDAPRYDGAIDRAIRAWNRSKAGVRLRRGPISRARIVFRYGGGSGAGRDGCQGIGGATGAGYPGPFFTGRTISVLRTCRSEGVRRLIAAHEIGHVLGLGHDNRRCALMNSRANPATGLGSRCSGGAARLSALRRRLVLADDARGVRRLYRRAFRIRAKDAPIAIFNPGSGTTVPYRPGPIGFSATQRNDRLEYRWDFGDPATGPANTGTGFAPAHAFSGPGSYTVTLAVLDGGTVIARSSNVITLF